MWMLHCRSLSSGRSMSAAMWTCLASAMHDELDCRVAACFLIILHAAGSEKEFQPNCHSKGTDILSWVTRHVGYRPGDPTAGSPPEDFSDADSDALIIDLATISNADMQHLCRASQCGIDPFRDLLSNQPGVRPNRQAHFTGLSPLLTPLHPPPSGGRFQPPALASRAESESSLSCPTNARHG